MLLTSNLSEPFHFFFFPEISRGARGAGPLATVLTRFCRLAENLGQGLVDRPGDPVQLPGGFGWERVEVPRLDVSSTDLRDRCRDGRPLDYLVTEPVLEVIRSRRLYEMAP